jgi:ADP-heptose:LPS heptosyltransferase
MRQIYPKQSKNIIIRKIGRMARIRQKPSDIFGKKMANIRQHSPPTPSISTHLRNFLNSNNTKTLLIKFLHGLGDCIDYSIVIKHLKDKYPDLKIKVIANEGSHWAFYKIADNFQSINNYSVDDLNEFLFIEDFNYPSEIWTSLPSSKVTHTLVHNYGLEPKLELYYPTFTPTDEAIKMVDELQIHKPFVVLNYLGMTDLGRKDLTHEQAQAICNYFIKQNYICVIADYEHQCPFADDKNFITLYKNNIIWRNGPNCGILYELIRRANLFIGIDSGPSHLAAATDTPSLIIWKAEAAWHPGIGTNLDRNCIHFIPEEHITKYHFFIKHSNWRNYKSNKTLLAYILNYILGSSVVP